MFPILILGTLAMLMGLEIKRKGAQGFLFTAVTLLIFIALGGIWQDTHGMPGFIPEFNAQLRVWLFTIVVCAIFGAILAPPKKAKS